MPSASPVTGWKSGGNRTSRSGGRPATDTGRPRGREHHHRLDQSASAGRSSGAHHRHHLRHPAVTPSTDLDNYPLDSPRHSSRPGWDTQSRLILQLQIVPAHQRSDLAHLVGLGLASYLLESKKLVYAGPPELGLSRLVDRRLPAGSAAGFGPHGALTAAMASTGARVVAIRPDRPPNWGHFMVAHRTRGIG